MSNYKISATFVCPIDRTRTYHLRNGVIKMKRIGRTWQVFERGPDGAFYAHPLLRYSTLDRAERMMFENNYCS